MRYISNIFKIAVRKTAGKKRASFHLRQILEKNFPVNGPFHFIQVGAWDGSSHDFLYDFVKQRSSAGLVIEPLPDYFEKLVANYAFNPNIIPLNLAIHASEEIITLHRVDPKKTAGLPSWAGGIASVDPEHHKKSGISADVMIPLQVPAAPLMRVIREQYTSPSIDLLQVDVEGYDDQVIRQIDFTVIQPLVIRFEYMNLPVQTVTDTIRWLKRYGYYCFYDDVDVVAVRLSKIKL